MAHIDAGTMEIVGPALAAGLMIALTHAPLGIEVLRRGIIFIDLAIAQIAGLGVVLASILWNQPGWWGIQSLALLSAFIAAWGFNIAERRWPDQQEAIIGCGFVLAASLALLLLADRPHGGEEIQHLLSGQILFVTWQDVFIHTPIYALILTLWFAQPQHFRRSGWFYALFAATVTSSVQLVGVYVVFASLILPALAAAGMRNEQRIAWGCGIASILIGTLATLVIDAPAGPVIVLTYTLVTISYRSAKGKI